MTTEATRLAVHVFGAGKGESIVLHLPDGKWGVVDCFAGSSADVGTNPVLQFLREQGVTELEFLCLTHPHDDHYKGMSHLLEAFPVRYFWPFVGLSGKHFLQLVEYLQIEARGTAQRSDEESTLEFAKIFGLVRRRQKTQDPPLLQKLPGPTVHLYPVPFAPDAEFQIIGLAPSADQAARYNEGLLRCFDERGTVRSRLPQAHHNVISSALLIIFGQTRIVLGGDVEREGWRDALREMGADHLAAHAVKVSHHGSANGYCDGLWPIFAARGKPIGVVTAYVSQSLPRRVALEEIGRHTDRLLTTCITALREEQLPTAFDPSIFKSRLALMNKMGGLSDARGHQCGRCTLIFDRLGKCVETLLTPPAGQFTAAS
jgi:hypothetical protein